MEELKKKIEAMTPHNAFLTYVGANALVLLLFLFAGMVATEGAPVTISGIDVMFGKSFFGMAKITFGFGGILCILGVIALIASIVVVFQKKVADYRISVTAFALFFIGALTLKAHASSSFGAKESGSANASALFWVLLIVMAAIAGFAYLRGNAPVELNKK